MFYIAWRHNQRVEQQFEYGCEKKCRTRDGNKKKSVWNGANVCFSSF
jgi:hypothetical protein